MGWLSCGRDAVSDHLGDVEGAVSNKRPGPVSNKQGDLGSPVSNPCPIIRGTGTGPCPIIRTGTRPCPVADVLAAAGRAVSNPCPIIRGTGTGPCPVADALADLAAAGRAVGVATRTGGRSRVR